MEPKKFDTQKKRKKETEFEWDSFEWSGYNCKQMSVKWEKAGNMLKEQLPP